MNGLGERVKSSNARKGKKKDSELQGSTPSVEPPEPASDSQNSGKKVRTDKDRRGNLPYFWYNLANSDICIRRQFLDYFEEPHEYQASIDKDRCCCNCKKEYQLGNLDAYYLYLERGIS